MKTDVTYIGKIRRVVGSKIFVEISEQVPSASPIIHGRVYRIGQVGSFVRIPLGFLNLYGIVSMVGASEINHPELSDIPFNIGQRWMEIQLVGESYGADDFQRGISVFPTLDDEVHIVTEDDLAIIHGELGDSKIDIGAHVSSESLQAKIDIDKLVTRHGAIVGSTGSGKSNTVAHILKTLTSGSFPSARVVVIDAHGEYASALKDQAQIFSLNPANGDTQELIIPYWALSFDELAWFFVGRKNASEDIRDLTLRDKIFEMRKANANSLKSGNVPSDEITADSPIPFDIKELWFLLDRPERVTYRDQQRTQEALLEEGNAQLLKTARFEPHTTTNTAPYKAQVAVPTMSYANKIFSRLKDKRFDFLTRPRDFSGMRDKKDLDDLVKTWIDHDKAITVLDLGGIPFEVIDLVVGVVTRILYETMFWGRDLPGIGRQRPLLIVFEEAHGYLPKGGDNQFVVGYASQAVRKILKEGRKYAIGALLVSQRPSELDETILSQCGTFIALRLSNADDQARIRSAVPDTLSGLIDLLPALRTGEAIILGESVKIPTRIRLPLVEPRPKSTDPEPAKCWKRKRMNKAPYNKAIQGWRKQQLIT